MEKDKGIFKVVWLRVLGMLCKQCGAFAVEKQDKRKGKKKTLLFSGPHNRPYLTACSVECV